ncbi:polyphosphate kinase 1 [Methanoregula sp.]|jgi:polyphosphate kinase|uniref:polyphosphate kinase 1 n=1 Tax=Methanoregula sp. TaxID=2052170 RepID=UPI003C750B06
MTDSLPSLDSPSLYINRELSWIRFNHHVLEEAQDERHPLLERVKFLAIFANNLDEFFMIRVSGLQRQAAQGMLKAPPDGMTASEQILAIEKALLPDLDLSFECWNSEILPRLASAGIFIHPYNELDEDQKQALRTYFVEEVFPVLIPLAFDSAHPFPFISNLSLNLAITIRDPKGKELFARIKVPTGLFPRLIRIPDLCNGDDKQVHLVYLEDLVAANLDLLFPGLEVIGAAPFRITRDADLDIEVDEASDLLTTVEEIMGQRARGTPVRIEVDCTMQESTCQMLEKKLGIGSHMLYRIGHPVGMADLMELMSLDRPDLKDIPFQQSVPPELAEEKSIFSAIKRKDILLYHPYDSFSPVINFIRQAAHDPGVLAIKITLYRVGSNSPIVKALMEARDNGKAVAALIELKARFDEENNIGWARALERAGVHVVYGVVGLKVHAKCCMVVRREKDGIRRYMHLGTGNYNATTSRIYTDFGMFTCDRDIGYDMANLFNFLTGYARFNDYRKLAVAPVTLRSSIISRIEREIANHRKHGGGYLIFKMNALVDFACINALYRASQAGVSVDLQVRGICCLRPGIPGVSENITVSAIVGRFLEHARIYYFRNNGDEEVLLGSADLMPRNLDRRVEVLFPVTDPAIKKALLSTILDTELKDNQQLRLMSSDGTYSRRHPGSGEAPVDSQSWFLDHKGVWYHAGA